MEGGFLGEAGFEGVEGLGRGGKESGVDFGWFEGCECYFYCEGLETVLKLGE
jgi:hypothetical protein